MPLLKVPYDKELYSIAPGVRGLYFQDEYRKILQRIIPNPPNSPAQKLFVDLWDRGTFVEMVNILPSAQILGNGDLSYSDGIVMGEAWRDNNCRIHDQLRFTRKDIHGNSVVIPAFPVNVAAESFVRFGHVSKGFWRALSELVIEAAVDAFNSPATGAAISSFGGIAGGSSSSRVVIANAGGNPDVVAVATAANPAAIAAAGGNAAAAAANAANAAAAAMDEFKNLVARMLALIQIPNLAGGAPIPLSIANNNLPSF